MKTKLTAFFLLICIATAYAKLRSEFVKPSNLSFPELSLKVSQRRHGNVTFIIRVTPVKPPKLSKDIEGKLYVRDADGVVVETTVKPKIEGKDLIFQFSLHKKLIKASEFNINSYRYFGEIVAGTNYCIKLIEFENKKTLNKKDD